MLIGTGDKETRTIRIEEKFLRTVGILKKYDTKGYCFDQWLMDYIGGYEILLELPKDGTNKATLRTPLGIRKITIKPTKTECDRDWFHITKTTFQIGEIARRTTSEPNKLNSLAALEYVLERKGDKPEQIDEYMECIEKFIFRFAEKARLLPKPDCSIVEERDAILRRPDFRYDKDYSFLYSDTIQKAM